MGNRPTRQKLRREFERRQNTERKTKVQITRNNKALGAATDHKLSETGEAILARRRAEAEAIASIPAAEASEIGKRLARSWEDNVSRPWHAEKLAALAPSREEAEELAEALRLVARATAAVSDARRYGQEIEADQARLMGEGGSWNQADPDLARQVAANQAKYTQAVAALARANEVLTFEESRLGRARGACADGGRRRVREFVARAK